MDKNTVTGLVIILGMLLGYEYFFGEQKNPSNNKATPAKTSLASDKENPKVAQESPAKTAQDSLSSNLSDTTYVLENKDIKVEISSLGARIAKVTLKGFETYQNYQAQKKQGLVLYDIQTKDQWKVKLPGLAQGELSSLPHQVIKSEDGALWLSATLPSQETIIQKYQLGKEGFQLAHQLDLSQAKSLHRNQDLMIQWSESIGATEKDPQEERKATINYLIQEDEEFDYLSENPSSVEEEVLQQPLKWVSFKRKFFLSSLIPQGFSFQKAQFKATPNANDSIQVKQMDANLTVAASDWMKGSLGFVWYFGPNDYNGIKQIAPGFGNNVKLSYDFLLPITRYIYVPLFDFLESIFSNYGLLIIVLVLIIKMALLPLTYKSYVSMAKTRILAPEIAKIREKIGDDAAKVQQETMKLYSEVGVNPLSGCVPVLATMPILMAVFMLFPNLINLRQESFLWANDLSTFDSFFELPFSIPFYGSHVSMFCLLMTVSQLGFTYYNNQITPDQQGQPIDMKKIGYIMPVMFMFVMNSFPAGLSFYYFVSNLVTIAQQLAIRKFVDEDKIKLVLEENRMKIAAGGGPKKSRFSQYLSNQMKAMEEQQRQAQTAKGKKKK